MARYFFRDFFNDPLYEPKEYASDNLISSKGVGLSSRLFWVSNNYGVPPEGTLPPEGLPLYIHGHGGVFIADGIRFGRLYPSEYNVAYSPNYLTIHMPKRWVNVPGQISPYGEPGASTNVGELLIPDVEELGDIPRRIKLWMKMYGSVTNWPEPRVYFTVGAGSITLTRKDESTVQCSLSGPMRIPEFNIPYSVDDDDEENLEHGYLVIELSYLRNNSVVLKIWPPHDGTPPDPWPIIHTIPLGEHIFSSAFHTLLLTSAWLPNSSSLDLVTHPERNAFLRGIECEFEDNLSGYPEHVTSEDPEPAIPINAPQDKVMIFEHVGAVQQGSKVYLPFITRDSGELFDPDTISVKIFKNSSTIEKTTSSGLSISVNHDGKTGFHVLIVDTAAGNTGDTGFFANGNSYQVLITANKAPDGPYSTPVSVDGGFAFLLRDDNAGI